MKFMKLFIIRIMILIKVRIKKRKIIKIIFLCLIQKNMNYIKNL